MCDDDLYFFDVETKITDEVAKKYLEHKYIVHLH